jgi:hypothetical protein
MVRMLLPLVAIGLIAMWVYALVDAIRVPDDSMYQAGNKLLWVLVILLGMIPGALIYLFVGKPLPRRPAPRPRWTEDDL